MWRSLEPSAQRAGQRRRAEEKDSRSLASRQLRHGLSFPMSCELGSVQDHGDSAGGGVWGLLTSPALCPGPMALASRAYQTVAVSNPAPSRRHDWHGRLTGTATSLALCQRLVVVGLRVLRPRPLVPSQRGIARGLRHGAWKGRLRVVGTSGEALRRDEAQDRSRALTIHTLIRQCVYRR
ncbi:hypothetical protein BD413DRAFT_589261 [Trametes elegans]|nr:hypothetical protein BD413DRAFT_589261 [Trametes elegans]